MFKFANLGIDIINISWYDVHRCEHMEVMALYDYSKLRGKISEVYGTRAAFAAALGIGKTALSARMNNQANFTQPEMSASAELLGFAVSEIPLYFFMPKVHKREHRED